MSLGSNKKLEVENRSMFDPIDTAFLSVEPPDGWEKYSQIDDFERAFDKGFLPEYWKYIYHLEPEKTRYALPFVMRYFASDENWTRDDLLNLEMLMMQLTPSFQHELGLGDFYETMYRAYSNGQKKAICVWLRFLKKTTDESAISGIDDAILYWCNSQDRG